MEGRWEGRPEGIFEVVWHEHGPEERWIEVTDLQSGRHGRVDSIEALVRFIRSCLRDVSAPPEHRECGGRDLDAPGR